MVPSSPVMTLSVIATRSPRRGGRPNANIVAYSRRRSSSATLVEVKATSSAMASVSTATIRIAPLNASTVTRSDSASVRAAWTAAMPGAPNSARSMAPARAPGAGRTVARVHEPAEAEPRRLGRVDVGVGPDRAAVDPGHPHARLGHGQLAAGAPGMAEQRPGPPRRRRGRPPPCGRGRRPRRPGVPRARRAARGGPVDEPQRDADRRLARAHSRSDGEPAAGGLHARGRGEAAQGRPVGALGSRELDDQPPRARAQQLCALALGGAAERVDHAEHGHHRGDDGAEAEQRQQRPARRPREVAERELGDAAAREPEPPHDPGRAGAGGRPVADTDRLDRLHPHRPAHGQRSGGQRDHEAEGGREQEQLGRERRRVHRQREELAHQRLDHLGEADADRQAEADAQDARSARPRAAGGSASCRGSTPSAMPMPISRRWASTTRFTRLKVANAAPASSSTASTR